MVLCTVIEISHKKNLAMLPFFLHRGAGLWKVYF